MILKHNKEIIIKLNATEYGILTATVIASLLIVEDDELKNDLNDLIRAITIPMN